MSANPILQKPKNFILYLLLSLILAVVYFSLVIYDSEISQCIIVADLIIFNILLAGFGLSFWFSSKYLSIETVTISRIIISHIVGFFLVTLIWLMVGYILTISFTPDKLDYDSFFMNTLKQRIIIGFLHYFLLTSFYYIVIYYSSFQERILKEKELKNLVTEAELKSLKFQINPHFVFNALNSMSALTEIDPKRAKQMIIKLADFLRYTLANSDRQKNSVAEELRNIKLYLDIEKIRFEDKFEYVEDISNECRNVEIPAMILQPLFENAIKHAVYETLNTVTIKLTCKEENDFLKITIENNFEGESHKKGAGVGIKNIKDRLRLIYNRDNLMEVKKENGNFLVNIFIPLDKQSILV